MATIQYLTSIEFENGAVRGLAKIAASHGITRPLLVTDPGIVAIGLLSRLREHLVDLPGAEFTETPANPTEEAAHAAAAVYKAERCDGLIAFGGGSSIDLAKGVALLVSHGGPLEQFALIQGGLSRITPRVPPVIAVPTTAGTGSEVGRGALITLSDRRKLGLISPYLIPRAAVCDPELTLWLPPLLTAATGMDALTHCIETFLSPRVNPPADAIALDGVGRAARWIEIAFREGGNLNARWNMMMASLQGGLTFQKGLGAVHSMSHPLGGIKAISLHHGTLNAVILPAVLRFNESHAVEKFAQLRAAMNIPAEQTLSSYITKLNGRLGLPITLRSMGITDSIIEQVLDGAVADHSTATNPRPLSRADFQNLFADAMAN